MRASPLVLAPLSAIVIAACSAEPIGDLPESELTGQATSAIINGQLDTTRQAVVAIYSQEGQDAGLCSGTIVKVDPARGIGWVLTAAHCVETKPVVVLQGDDITAPDLQYEVIDYEADPRYTGATGSPADFAVIRIAGVDATTPTIPLVSSPDGLSTGTPVVSVGYGRTTLIRSGVSDQNTVRRRVAKTIDQLTSQAIAYNMTSSGICQGDSGGPVLVGSGASEKVAGVHSYVQGDCNGTGVSGRVSFGRPFIEGELTRALPREDCSLCKKIENSGNGRCAELTRACLDDRECSALYDCLSRGGASCMKKFPKGEGPLNAVLECGCTGRCESACGPTAGCNEVPKCGFAMRAGDCATCTESSCCAEQQACAADGECYLCLKGGDADPSCERNALRRAVTRCQESKCRAECSDAAPDAEPSGEDDDEDEDDADDDAAGTRTVRTTGCAVGGPQGTGLGGGAAWLGLGLALAGVVARRARAR